MDDGKCLKCGTYLYRGFHTNSPGEDMGKEADDVLCLMLAFRREAYEQNLARLEHKIAELFAEFRKEG